MLGYAFRTRSAHSARLMITHNRLTELPSLTNNAALRLIDARDNQLQRFPNLKTNVKLMTMYLQMNSLTE